MNYSIYLVEDEENLNNILKSYLQKEGWQVTSFLDGESAEKAIENKPHLWILDIMLPGINGYELINKIKAEDISIPVIFISARDEELDRVIGLEMGSDDYLSKPFLPRELVIRTKKLLERTYKNPAPSVSKEISSIKVGPYTIDEERRIVYEKDYRIELTSKEFNLLLLLCKNPSLAFSREKILNIVWGEDYFGSDRVVDDLLRRIRKKLPNINIETIYGYGYRFCT